MPSWVKAFSAVSNAAQVLSNSCSALTLGNTFTGITVDSNFDDAPHAILLLFKIATGER